MLAILLQLRDEEAMERLYKLLNAIYPHAVAVSLSELSIETLTSVV